MKIQITKKQEIIDGVEKEPEYQAVVYRYYGSGEFKREQSDFLFYDFTLKDIEELRDKLNKDFPPVLSAHTRESN